ncbi:hypothetical protein [Halorussus salinisoli]|uniref:hypothetical protein n=1 Tax=Halorussus salinisoli TaxID=2558242 RepID=UPI0010C222E3|nr:hypothetical protein [Halorussus salinisoli]
MGVGRSFRLGDLMLGTVIYGFLGVASLVGGWYALWLSVRGSYESVEPGSGFRTLFRLAGIYDSTLARRLFWAVGGVTMLVGGTFFSVLATWS